MIRPAYLRASWKVRKSEEHRLWGRFFIFYFFLTAAAASRSVLPDSFEGGNEWTNQGAKWDVQVPCGRAVEQLNSGFAP